MDAVSGELRLAHQLDREKVIFLLHYIFTGLDNSVPNSSENPKDVSIFSAFFISVKLGSELHADRAGFRQWKSPQIRQRCNQHDRVWCEW